MERDETLERLKFLYDQVHQTAERADHLQERLAFPIEPRSLNYEKDLTRITGEYNRLVSSAQADGRLTPADLEQNGLPDQFDI